MKDKLPTKKNKYYSYSDVEEEARIFLFSIMSYYTGSTEHKIKRSIEFLDDVLFKVKNDLNNPFSNESRDYYKLANFSRYILIPEMLDALKVVDDSDAFKIHDWN